MYWVIQRDTFEGVCFPLYGPIKSKDDADQIAKAAQQEISDRWIGSQSLLDKTMVWSDAEKIANIGTQPALYETADD